MKKANVVVAAFGEDQVARLAKVTKNQLRSWDRKGFFTPSYSEENKRLAYSRVYSFKDVASLKVLGKLRNEFGISLQHLCEVGEKLSKLTDDTWSGTRLYVHNKKVVWKKPGSEEIVSQQAIIPEIMLDVVTSNLEDDIAAYNERSKDQLGQIAKSRYVNHNGAVISGTRIPVAAVKNFHGAGYSVDEIIKEYPDLTRQDIKAAVLYEEGRSAA